MPSKTYSCKFLHFRSFSSVLIAASLGGASARRDVVDSRGGLTIAYEPIVEGDKIVGYLYAVAKCHVNDNFNKHVAREKSAGRLQSKNKKHVFTDGDYEAFVRYVTAMAAEHGLRRKFNKKQEAKADACVPESCGCACGEGEYNADPLVPTGLAA